MDQLMAMQTALSPERLAPYQRRTHTLAQAVELYEHNTALSAALWHDIAHLEVVVRNAMHTQLSTWCQTTYGHHRWYDDPAGVFTSAHRADVATAILRLQRLGRPVEPGRLVAELTFGFWRYLLAGHYELTMWRPFLHHAFPGQPRRRNIHEQLAQLHQLRNRIGHHEPIYNRPLASLHASLVQVARWISPEVATWITAQSPVPAVLAQQTHHTPK